MDRLKADMSGPRLDQLIRQDMQDALTLKIKGTPAFFVNGRRLQELGYDELRIMVSQAVREAYGVPGRRK